MAHVIRILEIIASLMTLAVILFVTIINAYISISHSDIVSVTVPDKYGMDSEWLWQEDLIRGLDETFVINFMNGTDKGKALKDELSSYKYKTYSPEKDICIAKASINAGNLYAYCYKLTDDFPKWAQTFEAVLMQDIYLSTPDEFQRGKMPSYVGVLQAYTTTRKEYYASEGVTKQVCSKESLSRAGVKDKSRSVYTSRHGVLRSIDCTHEGVESEACELTKGGSTHELVPGGEVSQYEVFVDANGNELIASTWSQDILLGYQTEQNVRWVMDDCLFLRNEKQIGWYGLGYSEFKVSVPSGALFGKIQLIALIGLVWGIEKQFHIFQLYMPLMKVSRLGIFIIVVMQMVYDVQAEVDILRTITSWERNETWDYIFFLYILFSIGLVTSLVSLLGVRIFGGTWMYHTGSLCGLMLPPVAMLNTLAIALWEYSIYSIHNGMQYTERDTCPDSYEGCSDPDFYNKIYITYINAVIPLIFEHISKNIRKRRIGDDRVRRLKSVMQDDDDIFRMNSHEKRKLTSFEQHCLHMELCMAVIPDIRYPYSEQVTASGKIVKLTTAEVIHAAGFSAIYGRFLCRTRDLYMVLLAFFMPESWGESTTLVVWPLKLIEVERCNDTSEQKSTLTNGVDEQERKTQRGQRRKIVFRVCEPTRMMLRDLELIKTPVCRGILRGCDVEVS